jgi:hypothetical protein
MCVYNFLLKMTDTMTSQTFSDGTSCIIQQCQSLMVEVVSHLDIESSACSFEDSSLGKLDYNDVWPYLSW